MNMQFKLNHPSQVVNVLAEKWPLPETMCISNMKQIFYKKLFRAYFYDCQCFVLENVKLHLIHAIHQSWTALFWESDCTIINAIHAQKGCGTETGFSMGLAQICPLYCTAI